MSTIETSPAGADVAGRLLLIDGHSMAFRAFYALPVDNFTTTTGQSTNAVHGFVSMFLSLLEQEQPTHVAVAFDLPGGTFRTQEYADYKATRDDTPPAFAGQVELIEDVLAAMGVSTVTSPGYEADDILATLATQGQQEGMEVLVCSGDRDSFQTVTDRCTVLYPIKGVSTLRRMTPAEVEERYGVAPERYPHLAALVGETSDNLPGVPGVGPKTAAKWIRLYDGLDGVIAHADQIKGKAGQSLRDHLDDVLRNRRLNHLLTDLDLGIDPLADLKLAGANREELARVMEALEFRNLHQRSQRILHFADGPAATDDASSPATALENLDIAVVGRGVDPGAVRSWLGAHLPPREAAPLGLDVVGTLHPGRGDATMVALADDSSALVADLSLLDPDDEQALAELLTDADRPKIVADAKGSWHALHARGIDLDGVIADPSIAGYLCRPEQRSYDVGSLAERWLGIDLGSLAASPGDEAQSAFDLDALADDAPPAAAVAAAYRAAVLLPVQRTLEDQMRRRGVLELYTDLEMPVAATLTEMEDAGIAVDDTVLAARETELDARVNHAAEGAFAAAGHELNLSSPKQLQAVLFDELGMPKTRRTKTGYTTDADALASLYVKTGHPFLEHLLEHRDAIKLRQTVEGLRKAIGPDGRIHTTFQQTIAATGRLSSTDPNLQNIPARTEEGMRIREAFTVGDGYECLLTADYSQIEMRIMAHLSGDEALIEAFRSGEDLHRYVAALVHNIDVGSVTPQQRSHVKAMSYGLAYGLSTYGLARQLGVDTAEAASLREAYFARFGRVRDYLEDVVEQARRDGWTETMFGRRRYLPDLTSDNRQRREMAERAALNAPIQGSAADIVKKAMVEVAEQLSRAGLHSRILLQIHDELLLEIAPGEVDVVEELVRTHMSGAAELSVPLDVSVGRGLTWRDAAH
ncbi:DNA polymerase I [Actinomyces sp. MRS3W]|uniref:DNA polymerase I n=1 Tax=Actinomyces sp. MRS3W TaxID=2800796 RepID=UPI0028FD2579|nr:DNA polymerase I [Actinomyces sp. MRS3W]MDU0348669.1 DNA polymerase I [Actinomyces sp. MRS3W]